MDRHLYHLQQWVAERLASVLGSEVMTHEVLLNHWQAIAGDASARRYYRVNFQEHSIIVMDSSGDIDTVAEFVRVADLLRSGGVRVPQIYSQDIAQGFLLLEDFGNDILKQSLGPAAGQQLFDKLLPVLKGLADCPTGRLAVYGENKLQQELTLFNDWFLQRHMNIAMSAAEQSLWQAFCECLITSALDQPQVLVHRDFHSCNLHHLADGEIGVIDFQDALIGPISYDLVSWLWDRYISWSRADLEEWMEQCRRAFSDSQPALRNADWQRQCDWMGLQRNIKIVGIFARLHHRDEKPGYLALIPQFAQYILDVMPRYSEFDGITPVMERWLSSEQKAIKND